MNEFVERIIRKAYSLVGLSREALYANRPQPDVLTAEEANGRIAATIREGSPAMISRFGTPESLTILNYLDLCCFRNQSLLSRIHARFQGRWEVWQDAVRNLISNNVGFFPPTDACLERFVPFYIEQIRKMDMIGVWDFVPGESFLMNRYCPGAVRFDPSALEPYFSVNPWSGLLRGLRVLVVHPFTRSIEAQYQRREKLFDDPRILPEFDLVTVKAVQSLAGTPTPFQDWFEALDWMKTRIESLPFDVAIIGAGSYGLPLSAHVKSLGKIAIHMGGATQILFGIRGKRWDEMPAFQRFFNDAWVRPLPGEGIPEGAKVENGCYW